jgi:hypothetical protein
LGVPDGVGVEDGPLPLLMRPIQPTLANSNPAMTGERQPTALRVR